MARADGASGTIGFYTTAHNRVPECRIRSRSVRMVHAHMHARTMSRQSHDEHAPTLSVPLAGRARAAYPTAFTFTSSRGQTRELTSVSAASLAEHFGIWDDEWARKKRVKLLRRTVLEASREDGGGPHGRVCRQHGCRNRTRAECSQCERVFAGSWATRRRWREYVPLRPCPDTMTPW